jgi:hypothetical protein
MFQTKVAKKIKTDNICFFFEKSRFYEKNVENIFRAGEATDDRVSHAQCMLDN